jgi:hypothetical protein
MSVKPTFWCEVPAGTGAERTRPDGRVRKRTLCLDRTFRLSGCSCGHVRPEELAELPAVDPRVAQRPAHGPATDGEIGARGGRMQIGTPPRLDLSFVDQHLGGPGHQTDQL